ncbi:hypothetical protein NIASO_01105 [Niabella soli DSM 19437]|uniref:Uncharacterized protein n=1 Tax=Niabella soli DSM 19437 TaxID=929713 RepID=W0F6R2_9BACT|nr:hypothetical protein NIASO_01105 [Niabella soli DSM 19437]
MLIFFEKNFSDFKISFYLWHSIMKSTRFYTWFYFSFFFFGAKPGSLLLK